MKCSLCKEEKVLIKKSHLIPDFFFKTLYNEHSRLIKFDVIQLLNGIKKESKPPTSTYEKFILCAKCDNEIIGQYETYYANTIFHGTDFEKKVFPQPGKINHYEYQNLNYDFSNIFFLTLLWRANLSNRAGFNEVKLVPNIAESIRKQILSGKYDENSVRITALKLDENSNYKRLVGQFKKIEDYYSIIIRDLILFFHFGNDHMYAVSKNHNITKKGKWVIAEIPKSMEEKFLISYINPKTNNKNE